VEEGIELRNAGVQAPILVLGGPYQGGWDLLVERQLTPTVFRPEHIEALAAAARARGRKVAAHLKVDTGMGRIGVLEPDLPAFLDHCSRHPEVVIDGFCSQLAVADEKDAPHTRDQVARYERALALLEARGIRPRWRHLANSAGAIGKVAEELNLVRLGIVLYGLSPADWIRERLPLRPVLSWKTGVTHLKEVPAGTPLSYGSTWVTPRPSRIATLPVGYADGYSRLYSSRSKVLIRGKRVPIVGRVCMDLCLADVTDVPEVEVGDEVVLLGSQGSETVSAQELAELAQTISYEVVCGVGARVPRLVLE
jgi:alanine racemase